MEHLTVYAALALIFAGVVAYVLYSRRKSSTPAASTPAPAPAAPVATVVADPPKPAPAPTAPVVTYDYDTYAGRPSFLILKAWEDAGRPFVDAKGRVLDVRGVPTNIADNIPGAYDPLTGTDLDAKGYIGGGAYYDFTPGAGPSRSYSWSAAAGETHRFNVEARPSGATVGLMVDGVSLDSVQPAGTQGTTYIRRCPEDVAPGAHIAQVKNYGPSAVQTSIQHYK